MRKEPKTLTFDEFADGLREERQPRALVILASAQIDTQLRCLCEGFLFEKSAKEKDPDELLDGDNPLSTFSSRIKICKRLGLLDKTLFDALNTLRNIRNQAAHWVLFGMSDTPLREQIRHLKSLIENRRSYQLTVAKFFHKGKLSELESLQAVLLTLCVLLESTRLMVPKISLAKVQKPIKLN